MAPRKDAEAPGGMHDIDCALVFEDEVVAIELKLGVTALAPSMIAKESIDAWF